MAYRKILFKKIMIYVGYILFIFFCLFIADKIYSKFEKNNFKNTTLIVQRWRSFAFKESKIPGLIYEMVPNTRDKDLFIDTNSMGIRGREYKVPKPKNTFRILILGDSVAYGIDLAYSKVFSDILEKKLNAASNNTIIEIINTSVPGYNTMQEYIAFINKWQQYKPDLVLVCFCWNDNSPAFIQLEGQKGFIYSHLKHKPLEGLCFKNITPQEMLSMSMPNIFYMPIFLHRQLMANSSMYRAITIGTYDYLALKYKYRYPPYGYLNLINDQTEYAVRNLKAYCGENSVDLIFLLFPLLYDVVPQDIPDNITRAKIILENNSIDYFELKPYYKSHSDSLVKLALRPIPSDYYHLNALGHKLTADALFDYLNKYLENRKR